MKEFSRCGRGTAVPRFDQGGAGSRWSIWIADERPEDCLVLRRNGELAARLPLAPQGWLDGQFITQACNAHEALADALLDVGRNLGYGAVEPWIPAGKVIHVELMTIRKIHAALERAGAGF